MGAVLNSVMEDIVKSFAGNSFKKQTVLNAMKNRGVTDAELEASGMKKFIQEYKGEKIPVEEMNKVIQQRTDKINKVAKKNTSSDTHIDLHTRDYRGIREGKFSDPIGESLKTLGIPKSNWEYAHDLMHRISNIKKGSDGYNSLFSRLQDLARTDSPLYSSDPLLREKMFDKAMGQFQFALRNPEISQGEGYTAQVYTKGEPHGVSNHFGVPDYYSHVRYTDVPEGKQSTRYVHELQSDVHQGAKEIKQDGHTPFTDAQFDQIASQEYDTQANVLDKLSNWFTHPGPEPDHEALMENFSHTIYDLIGHTDAWINSDIGLRWIQGNFNLSETAAKGFRDDIRPLVASHEEQMQRIINIDGKDAAKSTFKQDENYLKNTVNKMLVDAANEGKQTIKVRIAPDPNLARSEGIQQWYENDVKNTLAKQAKKIGSEMRMTDDGYAEIPIPEKDFKLPMYSAAGLSMIGATAINKDAMAALPNKIKQAKDAGYSDDEIKQYLSKQYESNIVDRATQLSQPEDTSLHITVGRPQADQQQQGAQ